MLSVESKYWFRAKRYGWGWGLPSAWQGWVVLVAFIAITALGHLTLPNDSAFIVTLLATGALIAVSFAKGEPPRWRWGDRQD